MTATSEDLTRLTTVLAPVGHPLDRLEQFLSRFVVYPSEHARAAHVLWIVHTHAMHCWESTPRLAFLSPEPGSGKSRALEITQLLVPRPVLAVNVSPAYLYRRVADTSGPPTVLYDEIDTVFGPRAKDANEEVRGFLNAGHRRGATFGRCTFHKGQAKTEELDAFCALALAGLGDLPDTISSRSVIIRLRRRAPGQTVEAFRHREHIAAASPIRQLTEEWVAEVHESLAAARPEMPPGVADRDADVWEPLLAIADTAGGEWPARARAAAAALVADAKQTAPSLGVRLLADLREVFRGQQRLATADILKRLKDLDEAPWSDLRGKPIDARWLAKHLRPYGISSRNIREGLGAIVKGYAREELEDAWHRYLPVTPPVNAASAASATSATSTPFTTPDTLTSAPDAEVPFLP